MQLCVMCMAANANTMHSSFAQDSGYLSWLRAAAHNQLTEALHDVRSFTVSTGLEFPTLIPQMPITGKVLVESALLRLMTAGQPDKAHRC